MPIGRSRKGTVQINYRKGNPFIPLTKYQQEVINGEILGDAHIRQYDTPHSHCSVKWHLKHKAHIDLIAEIFKNFNPYINKTERGYWELRLQSNPVWDNERKRWYSDAGYNIIPRDLILTPTVCYHWYIGDGTLDRPSKKKGTLRVGLSVHNYCMDDVLYLQNLLLDIGFDFRITKSGLLRSSAKCSRDFLEWIKPKEPLDCYIYKWGTK